MNNQCYKFLDQKIVDKERFEKPFNNNYQLLDKLKQRNLKIDNDKEAMEILNSINYYRLMSYRYVFLESNGKLEQYRSDVCLSDI